MSTPSPTLPVRKTRSFGNDTTTKAKTSPNVKMLKKKKAHKDSFDQEDDDYHHNNDSNDSPPPSTAHLRADPSHPISSLPFITASSPIRPSSSGDSTTSSGKTSQKTTSTKSTSQIANISPEERKTKFCSLGTGKIRERRIAILLTCSLLTLIVLLGPNGVLERNVDTAHQYANGYGATTIGKERKKDKGNDDVVRNELEEEVVDVNYAPLTSSLKRRKKKKKALAKLDPTPKAATHFQVIKEIDDKVPDSADPSSSGSTTSLHASDELECRDTVIAFVINATDVRDECHGLRKAFDTTCSATTTAAAGGAGSTSRRRRRLVEKKELQYMDVILKQLYGYFYTVTDLTMTGLSWFWGRDMNDSLQFYPEDEISRVWIDVREKVEQEDCYYEEDEYQRLAASLLKSGADDDKKPAVAEHRRVLQANDDIAEAESGDDAEEAAASEDPIAAAAGGAPIRPSLQEQKKNVEHQQQEQEKAQEHVKEVQQQLGLQEHLPMSPSLPTSSEHVQDNMLNEALLLQETTTNAEVIAKTQNASAVVANEGDQDAVTDTSPASAGAEATSTTGSKKNKPPDSPEKKAAQAQAAASSAAISQTAAVVSTLLNDPESLEARTCCASILKVFHEHCDRPSNDEYTDERLFVIVAVIGFCGMVKSLIRYFRLRWLPEAAGCILVGVVGGYVLTFVPHFDIGFDGEFFLRIMVPPIVFEAALSIDKRSFNRHFTPILIYAIAGTLLSTAVTAFIVHRVSILLGSWCPTIGVAEALTFGALISSIDPIAVLSVLSSMGMNDTDTIYVVIFGEALLNDGVAIVLFETLVHFLDESLVIDSEAVCAAAVHFLVVAIGSVGVGLMCGALSTVYYWVMHGCHTPLVEVLMFFCWSFIPYYIADGFKWSGIVAVVAAGFVMDLYIVGQKHGEESASQFDDVDEIVNGTAGFETVVSSREWTLRRKIFSREGHLSRKARSHVGFVTEINAALMETAIFAYLGLFLFSSRYHWNFALSVTAIFACLVSRAVAVPVFGALSNCISSMSSRMKNQKFLSRISRCRDNFPRVPVMDEQEEFRIPPPIASVHIDPRMQIVLWFAGLRGAMSFALVENIPLYDTVTGEGSRLKPELKAMTSASIMFTVFILGGATSYIMEKLGYSVGGDAGFVEMTTPLVQSMDMDDDKNSDSDAHSNSSVASFPPTSHEREKEISDMMKDGNGSERVVRHRVPGVGTFSSFA